MWDYWRYKGTAISKHQTGSGVWSQTVNQSLKHKLEKEKTQGFSLLINIQFESLVFLICLHYLLLFAVVQKKKE